MGSRRAPPLLLAPGHLCDARLYAPQWPALSARARLHLADVTRDDDLGAMAERMLTSAPERFAIIGLSMGGMLAMEALARAPERVLGAALLDTDPTPARPSEIDWRDQLTARVAREGLPAFVDRFVPAFFGHDAAAARRLGPRVRKMMLEAGVETFQAQARALSARRDLRDAVAAHTGPLTVIWGARDRVCPPLLHRPLLERAADIVGVEIPACGHLSTLEAPDAVTAALEAWLDRLA